MDENTNASDLLKKFNYQIIENKVNFYGGMIYKIKDNTTDSIKLMKISNAIIYNDRLEIEREVDLLKSVRHPFITQYLNCHLENNLSYIIFEYFEHSLNSLIEDSVNSNKNIFIENNKIFDWSYQILKGLDYLHSREPFKIIHHYLTPSNIFIQNGIIKIGDFLKNPSTLSRDICALNYISPEIIKGRQYNEKIDIWSFGCILYELITLNKLFYNSNIFLVSVAILNKVIKLPDCNITLRNLLKKSLNRNHSKRESAKSLMEEIKNSEHKVKKQFSNTVSSRVKFEKTKNGICLNNLGDEEESVWSREKFEVIKIVSGSSDNKIKVWDMKKRSWLMTLEGHEDSISCLELLSETMLISGSEDNKIKIWDLTLGVCVRTLEGHTDYVNCLKIMNDTLISGSGDTTIKLWSLDSFALIKTLADKKGKILCIENYKNSQIFSGSDNGEIKLWDLDRGICTRVFDGHRECVLSILVNESQLISSSEDKTIKLWNINDGVCLKTLYGHTSDVNCLKLLESGELLSGSWDKNIKLWDLRKGVCIKTFKKNYKKLNANNAGILCLELLPNDELVSGSWDETISIWDLKKGSFLHKIEGQSRTGTIRCLKFVKTM